MGLLLPIPSTIETFSRRMDGTYKFSIGTQELTPEQVAHMADNAGCLGWNVFSKNTINLADIPKINAPMKEGKTPSARLQATLFVYWSTCTDKAMDFDTFYKNKIEQYISLIKEKLPEKI